MAYSKAPKQSRMHSSVQKEIQGLLDCFLSPDSLDLVAKSMFRRGLGLPSDKWSALNRLIMMRHQSFDARGPKAWMSVGRKPEKGGYFSILAPIIIKKKNPLYPGVNQDPVNTICIGFKSILVWPVEKTQGDPIDYKADKELPEFHGKAIAEKWGIKIKQGFENPSYYAYFSPEKKEIVMATPDNQTFFHELAHAADEKVSGKLKAGQDESQEIVAEFSAAVLMRLFGMKSNDKATFNYIDMYAKAQKKDAIDSVIPLISRISKVINLIMDESEKV